LKNGTYDNGFFYALDPNTNTVLWKYYLSNEQFKTNNGAYSRGFAVADGIAYGGDLTGTLYAFGKGPTTTETSVTDSNINQGTAVAIYGKVYDESPASPGAPVVNSQVKLQAQKTGETSWSDIGTATTDATGRFVGQWTPPSEGTYRVMAKFDGNSDYGWSSSSTVVQVNAAQAPVQTNATSTMELALVAGIVVVAILVVAVLALQLRKPKKQT
jgi:outer membrane protein assembly factor BamB